MFGHARLAKVGKGHNALAANAQHLVQHQVRVADCLQGGQQDSAVLHSYVVVKERILQVVSQIALKSASRDPADLEQAHAAALKAVKINDPASDA